MEKMNQVHTVDMILKFDLNSHSYAFKGKWGKLNAKGVLYNNNSSYPQNTLIYTIDKIGSFEYYCDQLRIK